MPEFTKQKWGTILLVALVIAVAIGFPIIQQNILSSNECTATGTPLVPLQFSGQQAYQKIVDQLAFGPRYPGSDGHKAVIEYIATDLESSGWDVEHQQLKIDGHSVHNLIAHQGDSPPEIILGAHYDTRVWADQDPDPALRGQPVPGANDGASGVAVLLELARVLPYENRSNTWLVFFDAEDQGKIPGWDWILGSTAFVQNANIEPQAVVIVDMIGDADLNIYLEKNSNPQLSQEIWQQASQLGYQEKFINEEKYSILDDHTPFLEAGIPAVDIIDFDYPYWHTTQDDLDRVSAESLQTVGDTLHSWLLSRNNPEN